ncbi:SusD/RagB family nutrient-binding outer membrane lipoprotein [Flavivirga amylovorans]|uniref:SusD/RagB family nutrient-binding outer membrane lipoprotein n=1 Tax=Flavivirga amylovorans TaxID=870486 RepID=A0ABT8WVV8_9FLAO|nr:SusD/RagB family nutrient-binding outer membrane lipoprotein [Flavivirga amylovorans]MDO5985804.1 SusD/RagB family nutrient-binding outer membrane lipoprotein [Flavivirga amylovorans]
MKKIKISITLLLAIVINSCEITDFGDEFQTSPNLLSPEGANPNFILNNIQIEAGQFMQSLNRTTDEVMRYTNLNESYADVASPSSLEGEYQEMYAIFEDYKIIEAAAEENEDFLFHRGMAKILTAYMMVTMVDYLGDIPFTEANSANEGIFNPKQDDDAFIYEEMIKRIDEGIADVIAGQNRPPSSDIYYGGDIEKWERLGNSLKLKMYVNTGDRDAINSLISLDKFITTADDFQFNYNTTSTEPDSRHPDFNTGYDVTGFGLFLGNSFLNILLNGKLSQDPRIRYYVYRQSDQDPSDTSLGCVGISNFNFCYLGDSYYGRDHGDNRSRGSDAQFRATYGLYPVGGTFDDNNPVFPAFESNHLGGAGIMPILLSSYVNFLRAEAALSLGTTDDALTFLELGIRESMSKVLNFKGAVPESNPFAATTSDIDDYVNEVIVNYNAADNERKLDIILEEYYLASFGNSTESYNGYRRTGYPSSLRPSVFNINSPFPRVFFYPDEVVFTNESINQRPITTQVFWDKNPAGFIE